MDRCAGAFLLMFTLITGSAQGSVRVGGRSGKPTVGIGQIKKDPAKELQEQRKAHQRQVAAARAHLAKEKWFEALKCVNRAQQLAVDRSQAEQLRPLYLQIEREGRRQLQQARQAYDAGKYVEALEAFEVIARTFASLPSGRAARTAAELAKFDPVAQAAIQESKAAALNGLIAKIIRSSRRSTSQPSTQPTTGPPRISQIKQLKVDKQAKAVDLLTRIAKTYGESPTGWQAAADLKALQADEAFTAELDRYRQARQALEKAQRYRKAGLTEKAIQYYKDVIRGFPGTSEAAEAEAALSVIEVENR